MSSNVRRLRSFLSGRHLRCELDGATTITFTALVDGDAASRVGGSVTTYASPGLGAPASDETSTPVPERLVVTDSDVAPDLRLISSPDFANADVGDLTRGPKLWSPSRSVNGTNAAYERVLDDWSELEPA